MSKAKACGQGFSAARAILPPAAHGVADRPHGTITRSGRTAPQLKK